MYSHPLLKDIKLKNQVDVLIVVTPSKMIKDTSAHIPGVVSTIIFIYPSANNVMLPIIVKVTTQDSNVSSSDGVIKTQTPKKTYSIFQNINKKLDGEI